MADRIAQCADYLAEVRREGGVIDGLPDDLAPATMADGYLIQDAFLGLWPDRMAGWKIGATAQDIQARLALAEPISGPFFENGVHHTPASPRAAHYPYLCLESEFAFRFGKTIEPRGTPYERGELQDAIDALMPAIELVGPRFSSFMMGHPASVVADCALNSGFVFGAPVNNWSWRDLPAHPVAMSVDGEVCATGTGANVLGDPMNVVEWAVAHLIARGHRLLAGTMLSTGTATGLVYVRPEQTAIADFGTLGSVSVCFKGPPHPATITRPA